MHIIELAGMKREKCHSFPYRSGTNPKCQCSVCFDKQCMNMITTKKCSHMCSDVRGGNVEKCCRCSEKELCAVCSFMGLSSISSRMDLSNCKVSGKDI